MLQKELVQVQTLMDSMTREREEESERLKNHYEQLQANYTNSEVRLELSKIISTDGQCSSLTHVLPYKIAFSQGAEPAQTHLHLPPTPPFGPNNKSSKMTYDMIQT